MRVRMFLFVGQVMLFHKVVTINVFLSSWKNNLIFLENNRDFIWLIESLFVILQMQSDKRTLFLVLRCKIVVKLKVR